MGEGVIREITPGIVFGTFPPLVSFFGESFFLIDLIPLVFDE